MNETDVRIKEDANDLVYDPNQEAAQPVAATAPAAENPAAAPVDAAPMTEPQPMTDSMPPVAPAVEATPTEVANAQEDVMAPEAPAEDAATDAASEALNAITEELGEHSLRLFEASWELEREANKSHQIGASFVDLGDEDW